MGRSYGRAKIGVKWSKLSNTICKVRYTGGKANGWGFKPVVFWNLENEFY